MTHEQIRKLSQDAKFLKILEVAMSKTASAVMTENSTDYQPSGLTKRHTEAVLVINQLQQERGKFAILIANTTEVNSLITVDQGGNFVWPVSEQDIETLDSMFDAACSANFNIVSGLTYDEMQAQ